MAARARINQQGRIVIPAECRPAAGLSLGERACLALALALGRPLVTADRVWGNLDVGVEVILIR